MAHFVKARCPLCGWQVSPKVWHRGLDDYMAVGIVFSSAGRSSIMCQGYLKKPEDLERYEPGLFKVVMGRLLDAVSRAVRWRWVALRDVLNTLPVRYLGAGLWVEEFERASKRPGRRSAEDYDFDSGESKPLYSREVKPITTREVKSYEW